MQFFRIKQRFLLFVAPENKNCLMLLHEITIFASWAKMGEMRTYELRRYTPVGVRIVYGNP